MNQMYLTRFASCSDKLSIRGVSWVPASTTNVAEPAQGIGQMILESTSGALKLLGNGGGCSEIRVVSIWIKAIMLCLEINRRQW
jgi:hypothetical protein